MNHKNHSQIILFFFLIFFNQAHFGKKNRVSRTKNSQEAIFVESQEKILDQVFFRWINNASASVQDLKELVESTRMSIPMIIVELQNHRESNDFLETFRIIRIRMYQEYLAFCKNKDASSKAIFENLYLILNFFRQMDLCLDNENLCQTLSKIENTKVYASFIFFCLENYERNLNTLKIVYDYNKNNILPSLIANSGSLVNEISDYKQLEKSKFYSPLNSLYNEYFLPLRISNHILKYLDLKNFSKHNKINTNLIKQIINKTYNVFFSYMILLETSLQDKQIDNEAKTEQVNISFKFFLNLNFFEDNDSSCELLTALSYISRKLAGLPYLTPANKANGLKEIIEFIEKKHNKKELKDVISQSYKLLSSSQAPIVKTASYRIHDLYNLLENRPLEESTKTTSDEKVEENLSGFPTDLNLEPEVDGCLYHNDLEEKSCMNFNEVD